MPTVGEWNLMKQKPQVLVVVLRLYYAHTHLGGMLRHASCPPARSFRFSAGRWSQGRCLVTGSQCCWTVTPLRAPARGSGPPPEAVFSPRTWPRRGVLRPGDRHWLSAAGAQAGPAAMHPSQSWPSSGMLNIMRNSRLLSTASPTGWWQNDSGSRGFCGAPGQSHTKFHGLGSRYRKGRGGRVPEPCVLSEKCMPSQAPGPLHPRRQAVLFLARREGQQRLES
ncbi:zinc finger and SCAN domain-containing protein 32 isoform X7 [Canis lupus familiaris]|uniref:zinc finger and SCAN domain-containing protein 32 isoform X7 n=1 Tax=Canis lupus familiaris TaxID=9615 RepID=UPI0018F7DA33|nr:zinc finger and SCAN domain-containing protein 32 isoform X7 [Canis lupus familiaris]